MLYQQLWGRLCTLSCVPGGLLLTPLSLVELTDSSPGPALGRSDDCLDVTAIKESRGTQKKPVKKFVATMPFCRAGTGQLVLEQN